MAVNCVTNLQKKLAEYIAALDKFNIPDSNLEMLLHKWLNLPENAELFRLGKLPFPSDEWLQEHLYAPASIVSEPRILEMYDKHLSEPIITDTIENANNIVKAVSKIINKDSVKILPTKDGKYLVVVTRPKFDNSAEINKILENAPRDEQGRLLAPNGKPSNLTEQQYAQVRTKAFKEWFGDWESLAEANLNIHDFIRNLNLNLTLLKNTTFPNSKIRNSVFHVSKLTIDKFSKDKTNTNAPDTELGYFFAEDLDTITTLREEKHYAGVKDVLGHNVHIVDINLKNPLIVDSYISKLPIELGYVTEEEFSKFDSSEKHSLYKRIREDVENKGYDGIQYVLGYELDEDGFPIRSGGCIVFDSNNIKVKSIKNDKSFTNFDAINNIKTLANNTSKVVDENGEPMVVYHGGAKNILEFKPSDKDRSTTGYGYYTEEKTGRKIPIDSNRTVFFSTSWGVAHSYALTHAITQVIKLYNKIDSLIQTTVDGKLAINKKVFNNDIENFFKTLKELSVYNPRYNKFLDYINSIRAKGDKISTILTTKEVNAFREMLVETRNILSKDTKHWNIVLSEWEHIYDNAESIEHEYNNDAGITRLQKGEIPKSILKEWALYKKKEANREKEGRSAISNYEDVHLYLGSYDHLFISLDYDGKDLYLNGVDSNYHVIGGKITELSKEEIQELFDIGRRLREEHLADLYNYSSIKRLEPRSQIYSVFLNIRNPFKHDYEGTEQGLGYKESKKYPFGYIAARQVDKAIRDGYDGVIYENLYDPYLADNYGVFNPNQIKSATDNIGTFSRESDNIYYNKTKELFDIIRKINWVEVLNGQIEEHGLVYKEHNKLYITLGELFKLDVNFFGNEFEKNITPKLLAHINSKLIEAGLNPNVVKINITNTGEVELQTADVISKNQKQLISTKSIETVLSFLEAKIPGLTHKVIKDNSPILRKLNIDPSANAFFNDGIVYLIEGKFNEDIAIEECLHPLVNAVALLNQELFKQLVETAKREFPTLYEEIKLSYGNESVDKELVTQALSRYTRKEFEEQKGERTKWEQLVDKFYNFIKDLFGVINIKNIKPTTTFKELSQIILSEDGYFDINLSGREYNKVLAQYDTEDNKKAENEVFFEQQSELARLLNTIYGIDAVFTGAEYSQIVHDIIYKISDIITEVERNPEAALRYNANILDTSVLKNADRKNIFALLGFDNILNFISSEYFHPANNTAIDGRKAIKLAKIIRDNIKAFVKSGMSLFAQLELFSLPSIDNLELVDTESDTTDPNVNEADNSVEFLQETVGDSQEAWQRESRTEVAYDRASILVKQALTQCYKLNPDGTPVTDKWGVKQRMDGREALQSIIKWTQGALTLSSMVKKLEAHATKEKWLQPIIDRLKDTSGKETAFLSQFFGVVSKYFQLYSIGKNTGKAGKKNYTVFEVNTHPALTEAKRGISGQYNAGVHPLFDSNGKVNSTSFELLKTISETLHKMLYSEDNTLQIAELLSDASMLLGYPVSVEGIQEILNADTFKQMTANSLLFIVKGIENNKNKDTWQPFSAKREDDGIINNIGKFIEPITSRLEDVANTSFYDSGNMYQSYVIPSYLTKLILKMSLSTEEEYAEFIEREYGKFALFKDSKGQWRNSWLQLLLDIPDARHLFTHKVQLNFDGNKYMVSRGGARSMSDADLTLSIIAEYFKEESANFTKRLAPAWFRVPLMSNKPSSEFIKFYSYRGPDYKNRVLNGCLHLFRQELSRMQTVKKRLEIFEKGSPELIQSFDGERGLKFCFFDFLNNVDNARFKELVEKYTTNTITELEKGELSDLGKTLIQKGIEEEWQKQLTEWQNNGVVEAAGNIQNISKDNVEKALENFFWNDFLASNNILNLTITDLAYYKNTEDVQKRLAQLHAPGIRANIEATDFEGKKVSDGYTRTIYLKDLEIDGKTLKSNIIENVKIVFNRKLETLKDTPLYDAAKATYESIIESFEKGINVTDAQGYASPSSYRKKALLFGKWNTQAEEIYQKIISGEYTYTDIQTIFQPLKPFVYTQIEKDSGVDNVEFPTIKMGVQNKNSEYLLIMAAAITQNEDTGMPNYLKAIYKVMEESHKDSVKGIDTVQFESTVKTGLTGVIDISEATTTEEAEELLKDAIYKDRDTREYDKTFVLELSFEDYCIQQEVPAHFRDHEQLQGSQIRMITVSDLNPNETYMVEGREVSAEEFRNEYEQTIAANILESINLLIEEFNLTPDATIKDRNIALAKVLQKEILSSPRYGVDLLISCLLDENGKFMLPLGDPIQSKRIEQLINSIVKNRVNKLKIAGGPIVQVSNFGTSRQLNIRFKSKNGEILKTLNDYISEGKTEQEWIEYIKENLAGIAYYEAFVPVYASEVFEDFMDAQGNIDIEAIEAVNPDLLKMIGYRIPSEDKYSMAPIKVVGFMPKEAGDGIMLPYEITLITGSDRDVIVSTSII